jgi:hypothetical protein
LSALEGIKMKKKYFFLVLFLALFSVSSYSTSKAFAQDFLPEAAKISKTTDTFKKFFEKGKDFSKEKWNNFRNTRDDFFADPIEVKGLTFTDKNGQKIDKVYFSISTKLRIHPLIKLIDEDGKDITDYTYSTQSTGSEFKFIDTIGYFRAETPYYTGVNILLPSGQYYVLAQRIPKSGDAQIWPVPVSKTEFKRLKSLKKSAIGEKVKPIDGYNC